MNMEFNIWSRKNWTTKDYFKDFKFDIVKSPKGAYLVLEH